MSTVRYGMACRLRPEKRDEYLRLHSAVWPGVEEMITHCGIRNFTIFVRGDVLFGYYQYVGMTGRRTRRRWRPIP